jgi:hypothetical protein
MTLVIPALNSNLLRILLLYKGFDLQMLIKERECFDQLFRASVPHVWSLFRCTTRLL